MSEKASTSHTEKKNEKNEKNAFEKELPERIKTDRVKKKKNQNPLY